MPPKPKAKIKKPELGDKITRTLKWGGRTKLDRELTLDLNELRDVHARLIGLAKIKAKRRMTYQEKVTCEELRHRARIILTNISPKLTKSW